MGKRKWFILITTALVISLALGVQLINLATANPIRVPLVPTIQIGYPLTSIGGYVNSTVEFVISVNLFIEAPTIDSISYSLDGEASVNLEDLEVTIFNDYGPEKIDYKTYNAHIILEDLTEGNHILVAYAGNMSASRDFKVNSFYHVTALNVLSPNNQIYLKTVPLAFTFNGELKNAHYYLYKGHESISEKSISGDMILDNLSDGSYDLYLFVTTEYGQDSKLIHFFVIGMPILVGGIVLLVFSIAIVLLFYFKRFKRKN